VCADTPSCCFIAVVPHPFQHLVQFLLCACASLFVELLLCCVVPSL
jgi:hypothetical protein